VCEISRRVAQKLVGLMKFKVLLFKGVHLLSRMRDELLNEYLFFGLHYARSAIAE
jgi:hypothetical protein